MTAFDSKGRHEKLVMWYSFSKIRKKCTKNQNARAKPLFCSLNLLFGDVLVAAAVVVY